MIVLSTIWTGAKLMGNGQGTAGNVIAAICSFFIPGLGQLVQGRVLSAILWFVAACIAGALTWVLTLSLFPFGWFVVSVFACINAALYRRPAVR
jgi:TM2 domain-containing membrane protein YozV